MYFHASETAGIKALEPRVSNHGKPLVYLSSKRENVLVYLGNPVKKHCIETGFEHKGAYRKWASYGFGRDGILTLEEYYPGATMDAYKNVKGYIYSADGIGLEPQQDIPYAVVSLRPVKVIGCEAVQDAYEALLQAAEEGKIIIKRYEEMGEKKLTWIRKAVTSEFEKFQDHPEYISFLRAKFGFLPRWSKHVRRKQAYEKN